MTDISKEAVEDMAQGIARDLGGIKHGEHDVSDTLRAQAARIAELEAGLRGVEEWWLTDGMHDALGAPHCIFTVRALIKEPKP